MSILKGKKEAPKATPFADFFRTAPSRQKKRVYAQVLEEATNKQKEQIARVEKLELIDAH